MRVFQDEIRIWISGLNKLMCVHACAPSLQSCPAICDPIDCSPLGSSVHGIFQGWILERVAMPSSRGSSQPSNWTHVCLRLLHCRQILYPLSHLGSPNKLIAPPNVGGHRPILWGSKQNKRWRKEEFIPFFASCLTAELGQLFPSFPVFQLDLNHWLPRFSGPQIQTELDPWHAWVSSLQTADCGTSQPPLWCEPIHHDKSCIHWPVLFL